MSNAYYVPSSKQKQKSFTEDTAVKKEKKQTKQKTKQTNEKTTLVLNTYSILGKHRLLESSFSHSTNMYKAPTKYQV